VDRWEVFNQGLTITGVGMGLVFLTLIIIAALIWVLSKVFPGQVGPETEEDAGEGEAPVALPTRATSVVASAEGDGDLAAAVAVALALQARTAQPALVAGSVGRAPQPLAALPWQALTEIDDEEITGEVVQVAGITGSANWKARGRLDGLR